MDNQYKVTWRGVPIFTGKYTETIAFCFWSHGISKQKLKESLELLKNVNDRIDI